MAARDDKLVDFWRMRRERAVPRRHFFEERVRKARELYRNVLQTDFLENQYFLRNTLIPDAFKIVETITAPHLIGMFPPNWFSIEAPTAPGQTYAQAVKALLHQGWRKAGGFRQAFVDIKTCNIDGHIIPKTTWKRNVDSQVANDLAFERNSDGEMIPASFRSRRHPVVTFNGPAFETPDVMNIWQDPTGNENWFMERIPADLDMLKEENKKFGGTLYNNLSKVRPNNAKSRSTKDLMRFAATGSPSDGDMLEIVDGVSLSDRLPPNHVELWQCWGWVPQSVRKYDDTQWRMMVVANGEQLLRDVAAPTPMHRPPYDNVQSIPVPGDIYGESILSYIGPIIEMKSFLANARREEILYNMFGTYAIDARVPLRKQQQLRKPGGALMMELQQGQRIQDVMMPIPRHSDLNNSYIEENVRDQQILTTSAATEVFQGAGIAGGKSRDVSAAEANFVANVGSSRFRMAIMWFDETYKKARLERMFRLYQTKLTNDEFISLSGSEVRGMISAADLLYDVDIYVDSGAVADMDGSTMNNLMSLLQIAQTSEIAAATLNTQEAIREIVRRSGVTRPDKYVRSEQEVAQILEAQAQQATAQPGAAR